MRDDGSTDGTAAIVATRARDDLVLRLLDEGDAGVVPRRLLSWRDSPARLSRTEPR